MEGDGLNAGRSWDWTVGADAPMPIGDVDPDELKKPLFAGAGGSVLPPLQEPPTLAGGKYCMLATCVPCGAPIGAGIG